MFGHKFKLQLKTPKDDYYYETESIEKFNHKIDEIGREN
jgi:hypothetical protein